MTAEFKMAIKKYGLTESQLRIIRAYKDTIIPEGCWVEEYTPGFKFYLIETVDEDTISQFFRIVGIYTIDSTYFNEEWTY